MIAYGIWRMAWTSPTKDLAAGEKGLIGHVRFRSRTCPAILFGSRHRGQVSLATWRKRGGSDMSGLGAIHVWQTPLEPGEEVGYVQIFLGR
jgi:hypothetical protein